MAENILVRAGRTFGDMVQAYQKARSGNKSKKKPEVVAGLVREDKWKGGQNAQDDAAQKRSMRNSWFFLGVNKKALDLASSKLDVYNNPSGIDGEGEKAEAHPFYDVLRRPNPYMGNSLLFQYTEWWLELSGEGYWFLEPDGFSGIKRIWPLPSNAMDIEFTEDDTDIKNFILKLDRWYYIDPKYICYFRTPNPFSFFRGLSGLVSYLLSIDTDLAMKTWNGGFFGKDNVMPSAIISLGSGDPENEIEQKDIDAVTNELKSEYSAIKRKTVVTNANTMAVELLGWNAKDMDFIQGMQWNKDEILLAIGVPPSIVDKASTEATAKVGKSDFKDNMWGVKNLIADEITVQIMHPFYGDTLEARYKDDRIVDRQAELDEASKGESVLTVDEIREKFWQMAPLPEGEVPAKYFSQKMSQERQDEMMSKGLGPDGKPLEPTGGDKPKPGDGGKGGPFGEDKPAGAKPVMNPLTAISTKKSAVVLENVPPFQAGHLPTMFLETLKDNKGFRTQEQIDNLKQRVAENGYGVIWVRRDENGDYEIIDGAHRLQIACENDVEQLPVFVFQRETMQEINAEIVYREWLVSGATNIITQAKSIDVESIDKELLTIQNKAENYYRQKKLKSLKFTSELIETKQLDEILDNLRNAEKFNDINEIIGHWQQYFMEEGNRQQDNIVGVGYADKPIYLMKGGAGSGHFNHSGRPGEIGGSSSGDISTQHYPDAKVPKKVLDDIKTWEDERRAVAVGTITSRSKNDIHIVKDGKETVGVVSFRPERSVYVPEELGKDKYTYIDGIATKRSGYGRQSMQVAIDKAKSDKTGLLLHANNSPVGFYQKLGMNQLESDEKTFYWTPEEIQGLGSLKSVFIKGGAGSGEDEGHPFRGNQWTSEGKHFSSVNFRNVRDEFSDEGLQSLEEYAMGRMPRDQFVRKLKKEEYVGSALRDELREYADIDGFVTVYRGGQLDNGKYSNGSLDRSKAEIYASGFSGLNTGEVNEFRVPVDNFFGIGNTGEQEIFFTLNKKVKITNIRKFLSMKSFSDRLWSIFEDTFIASIYSALQRQLDWLISNASENLMQDGSFWSDMAGMLRNGMLSTFQNIAAKAAEDVKNMLDASSLTVSFDVMSDASRQWASNYAGDQIRNIDDTTKRAVRQAIDEWIAAGRDRGIQGLQDKLRVLTDANGVPLFGQERAERIARSEATSIYAGGTEASLVANGYPPAVFKPRAHVNCRCYIQPKRLVNGEKVIIWYTVRDEMVCTVDIETPWGIVTGCKELHKTIVSEGRAGQQWDGNNWNPKQ